MKHKIVKGSAQFKMGIIELGQISGWLQEHPDSIGLCICGRSNVGKSSLINSIFGGKTARTSKTPGRTREINIFEFTVTDGEDDSRTFHLFDLPGYGHAQVSKEMAKQWQKIMKLFFDNLPPNVMIINIQDARHPDQQADQMFYEFVKQLDTDAFLVFNKMDKLKKQKERAKLNNMKPGLFERYRLAKQIHFVSAESKKGLDQLADAITTYLITASDNNS